MICNYYKVIVYKFITMEERQMKKLKQLVTKLVAGALAVTMLAGACPVTEVKGGRDRSNYKCN